MKTASWKWAILNCNHWAAMANHLTSLDCSFPSFFPPLGIREPSISPVGSVLMGGRPRPCVRRWWSHMASGDWITCLLWLIVVCLGQGLTLGSAWGWGQLVRAPSSQPLWSPTTPSGRWCFHAAPGSLAPLAIPVPSPRQGWGLVFFLSESLSQSRYLLLWMASCGRKSTVFWWNTKG